MPRRTSLKRRFNRIVILILSGIPSACGVLLVVYLQFGWLTDPDFPQGSEIYGGSRSGHFSRILIPRTIDHCIEQQANQPVESCNPQLSYCERFFEQSSGFRIVTYNLIRWWESQRFEGDTVSLFFTTDDKGKTWRSFMTSRNFSLEPSCENVGHLDENTYWFTHRMFLVFTHDAGETWQFWYPTMTSLPDTELWEDFGTIDAIYFVNKQNGNMVFSEYDTYDRPVATMTLHTIDGGQTWQSGSLWETLH